MKNKSQTLYLIRHAQTTADNDRIIGATDQPLSIQGKAQADELASTFSKIEATKIYTSGLSRANQTANILQRDNGLQVEQSNLLNEMDFGDWENQSWDFVYHHDQAFFNQWTQNWTTLPPPNGESFNDVIKRCKDWFNQTINSQDCVIVAHGGSLRALLSIILELPASCVFSFALDHCHVTKININQSRAQAAYVNIPYFAC